MKYTRSCPSLSERPTVTENGLPMICPSSNAYELAVYSNTAPGPCAAMSLTVIFSTRVLLSIRGTNLYLGGSFYIIHNF